MGLYVNGTELPSEWSRSVKVNGSNIDRVYVNGVLVWEYTEPCYSDCGCDDCGCDDSCDCGDACDHCGCNDECGCDDTWCDCSGDCDGCGTDCDDSCGCDDYD